MTSRIVTNLVFFAALGLALVIWALSSIVKIDALYPEFTVTADFSSSPGLRRDMEVAYLGVRVGNVGGIRLRPGHVAVELELDEGTTVPHGVRATVLRKSAVGEPYVELSPPSGSDGRPLRAGDHIPLSRTSVTVEYKDVFGSAGDLVRAARPQDARTLTRELGDALEGRGNTLHDMIGDTHRLTETLAGDASVLDSLAVQLTQLTGTLADSGTELGAGVNDLAAFTAALRDSRKDLDSILEHGPGLVENVNGLLGDSRPAVRCMLHALGTQGPPVFTPAAAERLRQSLTVLASGIPTVAEAIIGKRPEGGYVRVKVLVSLPGSSMPPAQKYARETPSPTPPPLYECMGGDSSSGTRPDTTASATPRRTADTLAKGPFRTVDPRAAESRPGTSPWSRWLPLLPVLAAALVFAYAAYRLGSATRRHRRNT